MKDRIPKYPGRVRLVPVPGKENTYDMVRADEAEQIGTPLIKANLLSDGVAKKYDLIPADGTPDKAFGYLGDYNLHWWEVRKGSLIGYDSATDARITYNSSYDRELQVSVTNQEPEISSTGDLIWAWDYEGSYGTSLRTAYEELIKGKYFKINHMYGKANTDLELGVVYKKTSQVELYPSSAPDWYSVGGLSVSCERVAAKFETVNYVHSLDRHAYPDNGSADGTPFYYFYLGIPFQKSPMSCGVYFGQYVGTGSDDVELVLPRRPNILLITSSDRAYILTLLYYGQTFGHSGEDQYRGLTVNWDGNRVSWTGHGARNAQNEANAIYKYAVIC